MKNQKLFSYKFYLAIFYYIVALFHHRKLGAVNFFKKSLRHYNPISHQFLCYKDIGITYYYNDLYQKSTFYLAKALALTQNNQGDTEFFTFLGLVNYAQGDFLKAKEYFEEALKKYKKLEWIKKDFIYSHIKGCEYYLANPEKQK